ncbi:MAG TPA: hypothetical protein DCZ72_09235 [Armatimonadetes bacterium]|nr:hypothetical protein [Armatimonadota bacterium]
MPSLRWCLLLALLGGRLLAVELAADLSNVFNADQLPELTAEQHQLLLDNHFLARPTVEEQMFHVYADSSTRSIPQFVTTDLILHTWHVVYGFGLRATEQRLLRPLLAELTERLAAECLAGYLAAPAESALQAAWGRLAAYTAVAARLLGRTADLPAALAALADTDLARIAAAAGVDACAVGPPVDFTQFIVRGNYTDEPDANQYFLASMWLGTVPFVLEPGGQVLEALLLSNLLVGDAELAHLWAEMDEPLTFLVGPTDDLTPAEIAGFSAEVFGADPDPARFTDAADQAQFVALVGERARRAEVGGPASGSDPGQAAPQFRLLGQRLVPDARLMQVLLNAGAGAGSPAPGVPGGLDVLALMGSEAAQRLIGAAHGRELSPEAVALRARLRADLAAQGPDDWQENLYAAWLWALQPLLDPPAPDLPSFTQSEAWAQKQVVAALGSWTEQRHDTLLYSKQAYWESLTEGAYWTAPGYVEPYPELYRRVTEMGRLAATRLRLPDDGARRGQPFEAAWSLANRCEQLIDICAVQAAGGVLSPQQSQRLQETGRWVELIMLQAAKAAGNELQYWRLVPPAERRMERAVDVLTAGTRVLQEAVGPPAEVWVIAPYGRTLVAFRGAAFTHHEFMQPSDDRLTNEAWQAMVDAGQSPPLAPWTASYLRGPGLTVCQMPEHPHFTPTDSRWWSQEWFEAAGIPRPE